MFGKRHDDTGDRYGILLMTVKGKWHIKQAKYFENQTKKQTGWNDVYVVHKDKHSFLFRGSYASIKQANGYVRQARRFRSRAGMQPFPQAMAVTLPSKPIGPPEWNIENVNCDYTVLIGVFHDTDRATGRKKAAVGTCRWLRDRGWDAYYHHGLTQSGVMIGRFDQSVAKMVHPPGRPAEMMVVSPKVKAVQKAFPQLAVNGAQELKTYKDPTTGKVYKVPVRTRLIHHPSREVPGRTALASGIQPPEPTKATPQSPSSMVSCDIRLVRVADGSGVASGSAKAARDNLADLAQSLAKQIAQKTPSKGQPVAVVSLRNRSRTKTGLIVAEELGDKLAGAIIETGWFDCKERRDLRGLIDEKRLDQAGIVNNENVRRKLAGVKYILIGGVTVTKPSGSQVE